MGKVFFPLFPYPQMPPTKTFLLLNRHEFLPGTGQILRSFPIRTTVIESGVPSNRRAISANSFNPAVRIPFEVAVHD